MGWPKDDIAKVKEYVDLGWSYSKIAGVFHTTRSAVAAITLRSGYKSPKIERIRSSFAKAPVIKPRTLKPEPPPEVEPLGPVGTSAGRGLCQYPYGDVATPHWRMCGHPGFPWCDYHKTKVFQPKHGAAS